MLLTTTCPPQKRAADIALINADLTANLDYYTNYATKVLCYYTTIFYYYTMLLACYYYNLAPWHPQKRAADIALINADLAMNHGLTYFLLEAIVPSLEAYTQVHPTITHTNAHPIHTPVTPPFTHPNHPNPIHTLPIHKTSRCTPGSCTSCSRPSCHC